METIIKLKKDNILRVPIVDANDKPTGESLEFDMEDIDLLSKYQEILEKHPKNVNYVRTQFIIIDKKQDVKDKNAIMSRNEKEKYNVVREFYKKETELLDSFLGENGTKKLLNGRKPYFTMFDDINEMLKPILPEIEKNLKSIDEKIKSKYKMKNSKENDILE